MEFEYVSTVVDAPSIKQVVPQNSLLLVSDCRFGVSPVTILNNETTNPVSQSAPENQQACAKYGVPDPVLARLDPSWTVKSYNAPVSAYKRR